MMSSELRPWRWELRKGERVEILNAYLISPDEAEGSERDSVH